MWVLLPIRLVQSPFIPAVTVTALDGTFLMLPSSLHSWRRTDQVSTVLLQGVVYRLLPSRSAALDSSPRAAGQGSPRRPSTVHAR